MTSSRSSLYVTNLVFLTALILLIVNDHYFKETFHNALTGKLSDVAGLIILPLFLAFVFPALKNWSIGLTAMFFIFWKSSLSQGAIDWFNLYSFIPVARVVDYTDLLMLPALVIPWKLISSPKNYGFLKIQKLNPVIILIPSMVALAATAAPPSIYYTTSDGNLLCYKCKFAISLTQPEMITKLKTHDIVFDSIAPIEDRIVSMTPRFETQNMNAYRINQLIIESDTLRNIDFTMRTKPNGKTIVYFNGMMVSEDISTTKLMTKLRKRYRALIEKEFRVSLAD